MHGEDSMYGSQRGMADRLVCTVLERRGVCVYARLMDPLGLFWSLFVMILNVWVVKVVTAHRDANDSLLGC